MPPKRNASAAGVAPVAHKRRRVSASFRGRGEVDAEYRPRQTRSRAARPGASPLMMLGDDGRPVETCASRRAPPTGPFWATEEGAILDSITVATEQRDSSTAAWAEEQALDPITVAVDSRGISTELDSYSAELATDAHQIPPEPALESTELRESLHSGESAAGVASSPLPSRSSASVDEPSQFQREGAPSPEPELSFHCTDSAVGDSSRFEYERDQVDSSDGGSSGVAVPAPAPSLWLSQPHPHNWSMFDRGFSFEPSSAPQRTPSPPPPEASNADTSDFIAYSLSNARDGRQNPEKRKLSDMDESEGSSSGHSPSSKRTKRSRSEASVLPDPSLEPYVPHSPSFTPASSDQGGFSHWGSTAPSGTGSVQEDYVPGAPSGDASDTGSRRDLISSIPLHPDDSDSQPWPFDLDPLGSSSGPDATSIQASETSTQHLASHSQPRDSDQSPSSHILLEVSHSLLSMSEPEQSARSSPSLSFGLDGTTTCPGPLEVDYTSSRPPYPVVDDPKDSNSAADLEVITGFDVELDDGGHFQSFSETNGGHANVTPDEDDFSPKQNRHFANSIPDLKQDSVTNEALEAEHRSGIPVFPGDSVGDHEQEEMVNSSSIPPLSSQSHRLSSGSVDTDVNLDRMKTDFDSDEESQSITNPEPEMEVEPAAQATDADEPSDSPQAQEPAQDPPSPVITVGDPDIPSATTAPPTESAQRTASWGQSSIPGLFTIYPGPEPQKSLSPVMAADDGTAEGPQSESAAEQGQEVTEQVSDFELDVTPELGTTSRQDLQASVNPQREVDSLDPSSSDSRPPSGTGTLTWPESRIWPGPAGATGFATQALLSQASDESSLFATQRGVTDSSGDSDGPSYRSRAGSWTDASDPEADAGAEVETGSGSGASGSEDPDRDTDDNGAQQIADWREEEAAMDAVIDIDAAVADAAEQEAVPGYDADAEEEVGSEPEQEPPIILQPRHLTWPAIPGEEVEEEEAGRRLLQPPSRRNSS